MFHEHIFLDAAGDSTPWLNVDGVDALTIHIINGVVGDTFRIWGSLFEKAGETGSHPVAGAVEVETAVTGAGPHFIKAAAYSGLLAVELDVDGGAPASPRTVRIQGVTRASRG